jgi:hypothetical protein
MSFEEMSESDMYNKHMVDTTARFTDEYMQHASIDMG